MTKTTYSSSYSPISIKTDIAIIGAGPTGLFAAFECHLLNMDCVLIDALDTIGGQCQTLYPQKPIYDIPAHPAITGQNLIEALEKQIAPFNIPKLLGSPVLSLEGDAGHFIIKNERQDIIEAKSIIIAAGSGTFVPRRPLVENLKKFEDLGHVHYFIRDKNIFKNKNILIAGGGDSALDWAIELADVADHIYLLHRRNKFRGAPATIDKVETLVQTGKIEKIIPYQLHTLHGDHKLDHIDVHSLKKEIKKIHVDFLLPFYGLASELGKLNEWGLNIEKNTISVNQSTMETSQKGIFAIGDVASYAGKLKIILQGFSEAAVAAHSAFKVAFPDQGLHFEHSTNMNFSKK